MGGSDVHEDLIERFAPPTPSRAPKGDAGVLEANEPVDRIFKGS
jgi:hypothetical protein